ncbi:MAG: glycosyltransferase family 39 protein, partial [Verrucomicrobia bacterium]|nr:glycosyltransferase family 39 protein [Verrucomicrobiota bacterium]
MDDLPKPPLRADGMLLRRAAVVAVALAAAVYAIFLARHVSPHAGGADSSGYLHSAQLLSHGKFTAPARAVPGHGVTDFGKFAHVPLGFVLRGDGQLVPTYPTGLPLQLCVAAAVVGWANAVTVVNVFVSLASGALLYALARQLRVRPALALGGVALLWACPLFLFTALQPMSDLPALGWCLAALYCAVRARDDWRWALAGGCCVGVAVLVRPTNLLLVAPLVVALGWRPRSWLALGLGGLPAAAFLVFYNKTVYGAVVATGYGDIRSSFSADFLAHNLAHFARWIPALLSPLVLLAAVAPFLAAGRRRGALALAVWAVVLIGFYAFYYHSGETWWYLRFILPAFPALILLALVALQVAGDALAWRTRVGVLMLAGLILALVLPWKQIRPGEVLAIEPGERTY